MSKIKQKGRYRCIGGLNICIKPNDVMVEENGEIVEGEPEFQTTSDNLYIHDAYPIESNSVLNYMIQNKFLKKLHAIEINKKVYNVYSFYRELKDNRVYTEEGPIEDSTKINENDCLKFGECMTFARQSPNKSQFEKLLRADTAPEVLQTIYGVFGKSDKQNKSMLNDIPESEKNDLASPMPGQSYAIVRKRRVKNRSPYHIAFVIHQENGVNITLEGEADNGNKYLPKFALYDTNPDGKTFHKRWSGIEFKNAEKGTYEKLRYDSMYNNAETIVLHSRDFQTIEKELKNSIFKSISKKRTLDSTHNSATKKTKAWKRHVTRGKKYPI
jgi:hypothetical protein